ncbi:hypothetical protein HaLaN_15618 [Haematococcus lacustris]|uniref:Uncharacterized protein n=1 Tax=Haematococcus lacustris TaxID=44745 RepID=A0A699ZS28_HAELA|nr:hypothetical protein HaLaN_15618 [Haematococcus lacustris]
MIAGSECCILQPWLYCDTVSGCGGPVPVSFVASISVSGTVNAWDTPHRGQQLCKPLSHIHRGGALAMLPSPPRGD